MGLMTKSALRSVRAPRGLVMSTLLAGAAVALVAPAARAAEPARSFGAKGQLAITGEELTGYWAEHSKWENYDRQERETNRGGLSLLLQEGGAQVGVHYFLLPQFSIGGTVGYDLRIGKNTMEDGDGTYSTHLAPRSSLDVGLRAGYALMFTDVVGFWFRGGPGMERTVLRPLPTSEEDRDLDTVWLASLDVLFVVNPVPHFGLYVGPSGDVAFAGRHREERLAPPPNVPEDWHEHESFQRIGVGIGLIGHF